MKQKQNFATTTSITSTYSGEFAGKYISAALLSGKTLAERAITIVPNVKFKQVMKKLATSNIIADATCDFTATGTVALTEAILQPKELQVNIELCKKDFRSDWEAAEMGFSVYDNLPANFTDFLLANVANTVAQQIEQSIWRASASGSGTFTGLLGLMTAGGSGVVSSSYSGSIDSSNVISRLEGLVSAIPDAVYGKEDLTIYIPNNVAKAYQQALGANYANGYNNLVTVGQKPFDYNGIPLFVAPGLSSNYMVAAEKSKNIFSVKLLSDWKDVGSWLQKWEIEKKDKDKNYIKGNILKSNVKNSYISSNRTIVASNLKNILAVDNNDVLYLSDLRNNDLKSLYPLISKKFPKITDQHTTTQRPWGQFTNIFVGKNFQVKELVVKSGGILSLQKHKYRSENWVVVEGKANVTLNKKNIILQKSDSIFIPQGAVHRIQNREKSILKIIEVQTGSYLGEDDIVRIKDIYGRA